MDTGAAVSLIPRYAWHAASSTGIVPVRAAGVVNRPECTVSATLATVTCLLVHERDHIGPLTIHALLADSDRVPLLLGMSGLLDSLRLVVEVPPDTAFIETL